MIFKVYSQMMALTTNIYTFQRVLTIVMQITNIGSNH